MYGAEQQNTVPFSILLCWGLEKKIKLTLTSEVITLQKEGVHVPAGERVAPTYCFMDVYFWSALM